MLPRGDEHNENRRRTQKLHTALFSAPRSSPCRSRSTLRQDTCNRTASETYRGKNTESGGSDPTEFGFQPPKCTVGSLPPAPRPPWGRVFSSVAENNNSARHR